MGPAIRAALEAFWPLVSAEPDTCRTVVVFSDGAAHDTSSVESQFHKAKKQGVHTMMVLIGSIAAAMKPPSSWLSAPPMIVKDGYNALVHEIPAVAGGMCSLCISSSSSVYEVGDKGRYTGYRNSNRTFWFAPLFKTMSHTATWKRRPFSTPAPFLGTQWPTGVPSPTPSGSPTEAPTGTLAPTVTRAVRRASTAAQKGGTTAKKMMLPKWR